MLNTLSIIGLGYIGLPTATLFALNKKKVVGVDINTHVVETINQGKIHIVEAELGLLVQQVVQQGYLRATTTPEPADAFLIAVPTPLTGDRKPDLSHVESAARAIAPVLAKGNLIILESTAPVGTTESLAGWLAAARPDLSFPQHAGESSDIRIAYCPERVLPGRIVHELVVNDRVVGGMTPRCSALAIELYTSFVRGSCVATNARTAEMCKLAENSFRDVNIAFANELSMICDELNIDVWELIGLANRHPRVNILQPGCGVGGHCIAIDPWFLVANAPEKARLVRTARAVNDEKLAWVIDKVEQAVAEAIQSGVDANSIHLACFGLTFKADIDDLRESPAFHIVTTLADRYPGCVGVVEPHLSVLPEVLTARQVIALDLEQAFAWATLCVMLVDHSDFKSIKPEGKKHQVMIDTRGIWKDTP